MAGTWKTVRVFISSTFRDMQAERDHLVRFVFPRLREDLLKHRIHLIDVDLRWGVTSEQDAVGVCREVIDECRPRFMGILGGRYGWVPEGKTESITADEIHYAVLGRTRENRGQCFFYFRDEAATRAMVETTPGDYREAAGSINEGKLANLKEAIVKADLPLFIYPAQWSETQGRLTGLEAFGDHVYADLIQSLKADPELADHFTIEADAKEPDEFAEEADQMEAFIEERTERFVLGSRGPLMRDLLAFAATDGSPNVFVLTGDPGSGKSAFLAKFTRELSVVPHSPFTIPHFIGASTGSTDLRRTLRRLCHELAKATGNTEPLPLDIKELISHFQKLLAEAAGRRRVILVFDALNQFDATDGAHWLNWLLRELPPGVRIVASVIAPADGQSEHQSLAILRNRNDARIETLKPLDESDTLAIIEGYLKRYAKRLSPEQIASLQEKPASNLPLYGLTALEELRTLGTYEEITERIRTLPGDARALFGWILTERLARDPGFRDPEGRPCGAALVEKFAACLGVSRHGLSPAELTALLDPGDPLGNVAALLRLLRPYLMRRGELLDFYHGQFREAAGLAYLEGDDTKLKAHTDLAEYFNAQAYWLESLEDQRQRAKRLPPTPRPANVRKVDELPWQRLKQAELSGLWDEVENLFTDLFFLEAKAEAGMIFDLGRDFAQSLKVLPIERPRRRILQLLRNGLGRDIQFMSSVPTTMFQCLWNSCWWQQHHVAVECHGSDQGIQIDTQPKLRDLLENWRCTKELVTPGFYWLRSVRPPPIGIGNALQAVLSGHARPVRTVKYSPDGARIASGSADGTMRIWDRNSGQCLAVLSGHQGAVTSVAYSPDGLVIASAGADGVLRIWDSKTNIATAAFRIHAEAIRSACFFPDGQRIVTGAHDKRVRIVNTKTRELVADFTGHGDWILGVSCSPDGCRIASASADGTLRLWNSNSGECLAVLDDHDGPVTSVSYSRDGHHIVSGGADGTVRVWNAENGAVIVILRGHEAGVRSVSISPDGSRIASGSEDWTIRVWDAARGLPLQILRGHEKVLNYEQGVSCVHYSTDGQTIVSGAVDRTVRLWDADAAFPLNEFAEHDDEATCVSCSPDGSRVATGSADKTVRLWDANSGVQLTVLLGHEDKVCAVCFSPDGRCIVSGSMDKTVRVWNGVQSYAVAILRGHDGRVWSVGYSPDGQRVVSADDETVRIWDASNGTMLMVLKDREFMPHKVSYSSDGRQIVAYSTDKKVRVWDESSGACMERKEGFIEFAAIAAGPPQLSWHAVSAGWGTPGTAIEDVVSERSVAWYPIWFSDITTHPSGRSWAGVDGFHVHIFTLEGGDIRPLSHPNGSGHDFKVETDLYASPGGLFIVDLMDNEVIERMRSR